jgi:DNA-binding response OmpR family regulator
MPNIIIVDDDPDIQWVLAQQLTQAGYGVQCAADGAEALARMRRQPPDLVLLDVHLPGASGYDIHRRMRRMPRCADMPVLFLTIADNVRNRVRALDAGADDFLGKPFDPEELLVRIRALLRRSGRDRSAALIRCGDLVLDPALRTMHAGGRITALTASEVLVLQRLMERPGDVCPAALLAEQLTGNAEQAGAVRWHVMNLRQKLAGAAVPPATIRTIAGVGYRLDLERVGR